MLSFILRRLMQTLPVLFGVSLLVFSLLHLIPGDPAVLIAGENAPKEQIANIHERLGLNDPLPIQYWNYMWNIIQGDLGTSFRTGRPVIEEIASRFPITFQLSVYSTIFSIFLGLIAGVIAATYKNSFIDTSIMVIALFGLSLPNFWLGLMLIQWFAIGQTPWLPFSTSWFSPSGWGSFQQMVLPVITLGTAGAAMIARMTRSSMLDVLNEDYIQTARAKGLSERKVIYRHALRSAIIPVITVIGIQFGFLLGGSVVTEQVFAINGLGRLLMNSITNRDFPVVQGIVLVISFTFVIVHLIVDILYHVFNKRMKMNG
ncbi:ABC transporter permease [Aliibacillus thermotolerans]|uniref:ABC transporter permease n=1 Tax=Aliibacillus thermotolerans TaxID=1834418 RepID=A0ABW0U7I6_9BACI|nr:ABC transporter permease [Aliibacillus thermotolerans]MDA3128538.1 ABC transporter permease subunit [Aliibacillus thermotolerans]